MFFTLSIMFICREALNAPSCDAIHITEIEASIECDTFMPRVDSSVFQPWHSSFPVVENNIRYSFTTLVRVRSSTVESLRQNGDVVFDCNSDSTKFEVKKFSFLPKMIFERHEEYLYLRLVHEIISNGTLKDDRTGTGTLSKFGCQVKSHIIKHTFCASILNIFCLLTYGLQWVPLFPLYFHRCGSICADLFRFLPLRHVNLSY